jgi:hypothetical protein
MRSPPFPCSQELVSSPKKEKWVMNARAVCFVALVGLAVAGCNSNSNTTPTAVSGTITINAPVGGEVWKIGDSVTITWTCTNCTGLPPGDYGRVGVSNGASTYLIIDNAGLSDSKTWTVGSTMQGVSLNAGFYQVIVVDAASAFQATTPILQIVNP